MVASRLISAALCAALTSTAQASIPTSLSSPDASLVTLQAVVGAGTTTACGMREAAHLIEHLLLSDTAYGSSPVDAVLTLRAQGIKLTARTHSDFTLYKLEGPADKARIMETALVTFLGRPSLPNVGYEREQHAILNEVHAGEGYLSSPSLYERFIATAADGAEPCLADQRPFLSYKLDEVQSIYDSLYSPPNIKLAAQAQPGVFDLDTVASEISRRHSGLPASSGLGERENARTMEVFGRSGQIEVIFPIAGRGSLPEDAANAYADQARLELQAYVRREFGLYSARSFVDQSIHGGWIRFEVPGLEQEYANQVAAIATAAMGKVRAADYASDPVWQAYGSHLAPHPVGAPVVALPVQYHGRGFVDSVKMRIAEWLVE